MFLLDSENVISLAGGSLANWFDMEPESLEGTEITSLVLDEDTWRLRSALTAARKGSEGEKQQFTCQLSTDGDDPTVEIELSPVSNSSHQGEVLGAVHSKTEFRTSDE